MLGSADACRTAGLPLRAALPGHCRRKIHRELILAVGGAGTAASDGPSSAIDKSSATSPNGSYGPSTCGTSRPQCTLTSFNTL